MNTSDVSLSKERVKFVDPNLKSRLGLIALATDMTSESDLHRQIPVDAASVYVSRVAFENPTTPKNLQRMEPHISKAADLLSPVGPLDAICYSCTAASVVIGDDAVTSAIENKLPKVPVVTPSSAARSAFEALGIARISVLTPYTIDTSLPMAEYFAKRGLDIQNFHCLGIEDDRTMAQVDGQSIVSAVLATDTPKTEGFFISCTALARPSKAARAAATAASVSA